MRGGWKISCPHLLFQEVELRVLPSSWTGERGPKYSWAHRFPARLPEVRKKANGDLMVWSGRRKSPRQKLLGTSALFYSSEWTEELGPRDPGCSAFRFGNALFSQVPSRRPEG